MNFDIILSGVGGQGVLSLSAIIASSAMKEGLHVKQSEVHGMSQRGGAVLANLRLSDSPISSDLIPKGSAHMILSMEPMESLRYLAWLSENGTLITSSDPVVNIPNYPDMEEILGAIRSLPHSVIVESARLAREAGSPRASNMVIIGAASRLLPVKDETIDGLIGEMFERKGEKVVEINRKAYRLGKELAQ